MSPRDQRLGRRAEAVFDALLHGRSETLHPGDRDEAAAFWDWLGQRERPADDPSLPARLWLRWPHLAAAAAVVLALGATLGIGWQMGGEPGYARELRTGHGERGLARLPDGSVVTLAADTRVRVAFSHGVRDLRLEQGQALFEVAHNPKRPFIVHTPHGDVRAVGTAFDVTLARDEAEVTVVDGVVRIALERGPGPAREPIETLARKGERVAFGLARGGQGTFAFIRPSRAVDIEGATAWTQGKLVFHGEPLARVIETINRYSSDRVELADPKAANLPVYGVINQGDTAAIRDLIAHPDAVVIEHRRTPAPGASPAPQPAE